MDSSYEFWMWRRPAAQRAVMWDNLSRRHDSRIYAR